MGLTDDDTICIIGHRYEQPFQKVEIMSYLLNCTCDDCGTVGLCVRIDDETVVCDNCLTNDPCQIEDEFDDCDEDEFVFGEPDDEFCAEDDIDPEFEDDGQPSEYTEWQDLYGGDDSYQYDGYDCDFGMDG